MSSEPGGGRAGRTSRRILALLFFASGAAGLVDQVAWLRYLSLVFGNTTLATATLLAVFLGGLGAGAALFGRLAARLGTRHLVATVPLALFGIFRFLFLLYQKPDLSSPTDAILHDPPFLVNLVLWGTTVLVLIYVL